MVQVLGTQTILEFVSESSDLTQRLAVHPKLQASEPRASSETMAKAKARHLIKQRASGSGSATMTNAWVSRASSDLDAITTFCGFTSCFLCVHPHVFLPLSSGATAACHHVNL